MNRKLKLALAALLGFSTACSTVKNASSKKTEKTDDAAIPADTVKIIHPIVVMYGVRPPIQSTEHRSLSSVLQENGTAAESQETPATQQPETPSEN